MRIINTSIKILKYKMMKFNFKNKKFLNNIKYACKKIMK